MPSLYTPVAPESFPTEVQLPENGDKGNGLTFKTPLKTLADMAQYVKQQADGLSAVVGGLVSRTDPWTWITTNTLPVMRGSSGKLEYVHAPSDEIVLSPTEAVWAQHDTVRFNVSHDALQIANQVASPQTKSAYFPIRLRAGAVITRIRCRINQTTSTRIKMRLWQMDVSEFAFDATYAAPTTTQLEYGEATVSTGQKSMGTDMSVTVDPRKPLVLQVELNAAASTNGDALYGVLVRANLGRV